MKRLAQLRKERQLSQTGLAMKLYLSQYLISSYENGRHQPDVEMLIKLADFFNVSIDYLVGRSDVRTVPHAVGDPEFTEDELLMLDRYAALSTEQKTVARELLRLLHEYRAV